MNTEPNYWSGEDYVVEFLGYRFGFNAEDFEQRVTAAAVKLGLLEGNELDDDETADLVELAADGVIQDARSGLGRYLVRHELNEAGRLRYTVDDNGCWIWDRAISSAGYGVIRYNGQLIYVHRLMYLGMIQPGEHVHHRCEVRACVNPEHLETVEAGEHTRHHARSAATCKRGHPWTEENTYYRPDAPERRQEYQGSEHTGAGAAQRA